MIRITELTLPVSCRGEAFEEALRQKLGISALHPMTYTIVRRSIDARIHRGSAHLTGPAQPHFVYTLDVNCAKEEKVLKRAVKNHLHAQIIRLPAPYQLPDISRRPDLPPVVVGMGPAGLFCALALAKKGLCPIVIERGRPVDQRRLDTQAFFNKQILDPESNVQFGEGGAGAFSDGKVNTLIKDPSHMGHMVMKEFVKAGAPEEILYDAKPHIGTDRLQTAVKAMRQEIESLGGSIRFSTRLDDLVMADGQVRGIVVTHREKQETIDTDALFLAIGHSARDTFAMLDRRHVLMEEKPFAIGVRIEHPRAMIDQDQYKEFAQSPYLGAASYKLAYHTSFGRSLYTFCMCPGGYVIASASEPKSVVTNGMSNYARDAENSNSALLVGITPDDYASYRPQGGVLSGCLFQRDLEQAAFRLGGSTYAAPIQTVGDLMAGKPSTSASLGDIRPSFTGKVTPTDLTRILPKYVTRSLREGLPYFGTKIHGFDRPDAVLTGLETRSSSPVRIVRDSLTGQALLAEGRPSHLYPMGEGAGYAGGITSAAIDGLKMADLYLKTLQ